VAHRTTLL